MQPTALLLFTTLVSGAYIHLPRAKTNANATSTQSLAASSNATLTRRANNNSNSTQSLAAPSNSTLTRRANNNNPSNSTQSTNSAAADFGSCTPTMDFQLGSPEFNRTATDDGTFFPTDATLVGSSGQSDALDPNVIARFICDQLLTNAACGAREAGVAACQSGESAVRALGVKDQRAADAFNSALGF